MADDTTPESTTTNEDIASAPVDPAKNSTVPVSARIATVGGLVRAKVKMVGAWSANQSGQKLLPSRKKDN